MKFFIHSFGCRVNQYEGEKIRQGFERGSFETAQDWREADVCVINTCSVTDHADRDARVLIRKISEANPAARLVVTGCWASRDPEGIQKLFPQVTIVGNEGKETIPALFGCSMGLSSGQNALQSFSKHTRAFIKVQDGCNMRCAYCIIPSTRPVMSSRAPQEVLDEIAGLIEAGYKEFVLCGIRLGRYWAQGETGRGSEGVGKCVALAGLIGGIAGLPGDFRIRLSSIEITDLTDRFLEGYAATPKTVLYFHVPLQSGSDRVLAAMKRWYDTRFYSERLAAARRVLGPDTAIFTDVMVGFPTETDKDFNESLAFAEDMGFAGLHIFRYSPRQGTPAARLSSCYGPKDLEQRLQAARELDARLRSLFARRFVGRQLAVLDEQRAAGTIIARAENFLEVEMPLKSKPWTHWHQITVAQEKKGRLLAQPGALAERTLFF